MLPCILMITLRRLRLFSRGSASGVYRALKQFKISRKKVLYKERNESDRQEFLQSLEDIPSDKLVWVDEYGVEEKTDRLYAGSQGQRVYGEASGKRTIVE